MERFDMTPEEAHIMVHVLASTLSDLRMEISDTDSYDYRVMLKERKRVIRKVLDQFETMAESVAS